MACGEDWKAIHKITMEMWSLLTGSSLHLSHIDIAMMAVPSDSKDPNFFFDEHL